MTPHGRAVIKVLSVQQDEVELGFTMPKVFRYLKRGIPKSNLGGKAKNDNSIADTSKPPTNT
jgi:sRNA-binding carbon storage regulator CsrA